MICLDFDWQIDEFMVYCRSTQLREKTMKSYEQTLRLFERWCMSYLLAYQKFRILSNYEACKNCCRRSVGIANPSPRRGGSTHITDLRVAFS